MKTTTSPESAGLVSVPVARESPVTPQPLLHADGLSRSYGGRAIVDIDSLELHSGEVLAVLGPNGAGKSTLFRMLLLLEQGDSGRIVFDGREVRCGDRGAQERMAGVFQRAFLFEGSVADNVAFGLRARGVPRRGCLERVDEALGWLGIRHLAGAPVINLSGGEAQRVALARALALRPEILFLDEPTANLDISVRKSFRADLDGLVRARTRSALLITHDPIDAFDLADRIAVIQAGRLVQVGRPHELVEGPATPFVAAITGAEFMTGGILRGRESRCNVVEFPGGARVGVAGSVWGPGIGSSVQVAYRPEDIDLTGEGEGADESWNRLQLRVAGIDAAGAMVRVRLEGGISIFALTTRRSLARLDLVPGSEVVAGIEATALHLFPA